MQPHASHQVRDDTLALAAENIFQVASAWCVAKPLHGGDDVAETRVLGVPAELVKVRNGVRGIVQAEQAIMDYPGVRFIVPDDVKQSLRGLCAWFVGKSWGKLWSFHVVSLIKK
jgi:hypothetical protein